MIIYAVYFMTEDGKTILFENFQNAESLPNETLFGGILTALQQLTAEMTQKQSEMKSIEIEGLSYHIRSFGVIRVVLITDLPKTPEDIIHSLGLQFINQFGEEIMQDAVNINIFNSFKGTIHEIIGKNAVIDLSKQIQPEKRMTTEKIFILPTHVQSTALALLSLESATVKEIAEESKNSLQKTEENIIILQQNGYIGKKEEDGIIEYFCVI